MPDTTTIAEMIADTFGRTVIDADLKLAAEIIARIRTPHPLDGNPLMADVVKTIRDTYGVSTRPGAEAALAEWPHTAELTDREREWVLRQFPASAVIELTFDDADRLAQLLDDEHERICASNYSGRDHSDDIEFIERIVPKLRG